MQKYSKEMSDNERQNIFFHVVRHKEILTSIYLGCTERAIKVLLLINSGGLIAILAYLYKGDTSKNAKIFFESALTFFLFGLIATCILIGMDFFIVLFRNKKYLDDTSAFFSGKKTFSEIREFSKSPWIATSLLISCGIASIVLTGFGIYNGYNGFIINHH